MVRFIQSVTLASPPLFTNKFSVCFHKRGNGKITSADVLEVNGNTGMLVVNSLT
jgi:hypothetical protein